MVVPCFASDAGGVCNIGSGAFVNSSTSASFPVLPVPPFVNDQQALPDDLSGLALLMYLSAGAFL
jgi:hypothetical protein